MRDQKCSRERLESDILLGMLDRPGNGRCVPKRGPGEVGREEQHLGPCE